MMIRFVMGVVVGAVAGIITYYLSTRQKPYTESEVSEATYDNIYSSKSKDGHADCILCYNAGASMVFAPCGHMCCCPVCAKRVKEEQGMCPLCRRRIINVIRTYT